MATYPRSPTKKRKETDFEIPCREHQVQILRSLFGEAHHLTFPTIFIYGHSSTGKTHVVKNMFKIYNVPHVWINCIVVYNQRLLFEAVLKQLSTLNPKSKSLNFSTDNTCEFLHHIRQSLKENVSEEPTVYLVFDKAEKLCNMNPTVLATIVRLQELTSLNLCVIIISENSWDKFRCGTHLPEPYILHFPQYSKDEILEILVMDCPQNYSHDFYTKYLQLVLNLCLTVTHNLQELRYIALSNFKKYCEPLETDQVTEDNKLKLWKNAAPHLKNSLSTVYLRESSVKGTMDQPESQNILTNRANMELPFFSKFLLLAGYIASYNPPKSDKQMFLKNCGRIRKKQVRTNAKRIVSQHERGPKAFPLHRMLAIFYSIIEEEPKPSTYLLSQISTLVSLRLLLPVGTDLDLPKYKCIVTLEFIRSISRTVNFDIVGYLSDFQTN